ncbi:pilus assembly protein [Vulcanibacillus modesticaldus]|uniref:Pilus assembly protein n=2 Tax=Vulcanibacillus modesticaldus TaxID=337097 RepID=A0A1D2YV34_9BACI|nr:pilus assembly protein [Vulcanibacillus modesticaldus]
MKQRIKDRVRNVLTNEKGQGMVEYGLILALISVVVIVMLTGIGQNLLNRFTDVNNNLTPNTSSTPGS